MDLKYFGYTEFMNRFGKREITRLDRQTPIPFFNTVFLNEFLKIYA